MPRVVAVFSLIVLLATAGCSSLRFPGVYRIDIPQGNFVTEEMLEQIEPGMTPEQIRFALGAPTLVDPFTPDSWFYLMTYQPGRGEKVRQQIIVHFEDGLYSHYQGEVISDLRRKTRGQQDRELEQQLREQRRNGQPQREAAPEPSQETPPLPPGSEPGPMVGP